MFIHLLPLHIKHSRDNKAYILPSILSYHFYQSSYFSPSAPYMLWLYLWSHLFSNNKPTSHFYSHARLRNKWWELLFLNYITLLIWLRLTFQFFRVILNIIVIILFNSVGCIITRVSPSFLSCTTYSICFFKVYKFPIKFLYVICFFFWIIKNNVVEII